MKIVYKQPKKTADISAGKDSAFSEFWQLALLCLIVLVVLFYSISFVVDSIVSRISYETEATLFKAFDLSNIHTKKGSVKNGDDTQISTILEKLLKSTKVPPLPYKIMVIDDKRINAFAFPGGSIGITTGLMERLNDEIAIAFVVGHELGHFKHRDHLRGLGRSLGFGIALSIIFGKGLSSDSFTNLIAGVMVRNYSQEREKMADAFGIELVRDVYGKTQGTDQLFKVLLNEGNSIPEWAHMFSTHPSPKQRIKDLKQWVEEFERRAPRNPIKDD